MCPGADSAPEMSTRDGRMKNAWGCIPYVFKALGLIKDKDILFYIFGASYKSWNSNNAM